MPEVPPGLDREIYEDLLCVRDGRKVFQELGKPMEVWEALSLVKSDREMLRDEVRRLTQLRREGRAVGLARAVLERLGILRTHLGPLVQDLRRFLTRVPGTPAEEELREILIGFIAISPKGREAASRWTAHPADHVDEATLKVRTLLRVVEPYYQDLRRHTAPASARPEPAPQLEPAVFTSTPPEAPAPLEPPPSPQVDLPAAPEPRAAEARVEPAASVAAVEPPPAAPDKDAVTPPAVASAPLDEMKFERIRSASAEEAAPGATVETPTRGAPARPPPQMEDAKFEAAPPADTPTAPTPAMEDAKFEAAGVPAAVADPFNAAPAPLAPAVDETESPDSARRRIAEASRLKPLPPLPADLPQGVDAEILDDVRRVEQCRKVFEVTHQQIEVWEVFCLVMLDRDATKRTMGELLDLKERGEIGAFTDGALVLFEKLLDMRSKYGRFVRRLRDYIGMLEVGHFGKETMEMALGFVVASARGRERAQQWLDEPERHKQEAAGRLEDVISRTMKYQTALRIVQ